MKNFLLIILMQCFATFAIAQVSGFQETIHNTTQQEKGATGDGQYRNDYPPIWDEPTSGGSSMGIICKGQSNPRVNDVPLEINDFIGGFYTDDFGQLRCGGAEPWPGTLGVVIALKGDNPATPEKDGFSYLEQIYFKVFSWERMKDYDVDIITFDPNSPTTDKWISLAISEVINIQALVDFDFYISVSENPICLGSSITLSANEFVGSNGSYTYNWTSIPPGFSSGLPNPPATTPLVNTAYQLTVSDGTNVSNHEYSITVNEVPQVTVGDDGYICYDANFTVSGSAINYSNFQWTTSGDGYFVNDHVFVTNYYTGPIDKSTGTVFLTLTAYPLAPCTATASDFITLNIQQPPNISAGPDFQACKNPGNGVPIEAIGNNYDYLLWTSDGDGTFADANSASTLYYPGTVDYNYGDVDLEVCVQSLSPCLVENCDEVNLSFTDNPTCFGPTVLSRCENIPIPLAGAVNNSSGSLWTTQGDGTFADPQVIFTNYTGGVNDRLTGTTIVTLNALPISPCTVAATKDVQLIFKPLPRLATFGTNTNFLCPGNSYLQLNAQLSHYNTFSWSTLGDGYFTGASSLSPKYYPGIIDLQNGFFELQLTATPLTPCTLSKIFTLETIIASDPEANISTANGSAWCGAVNLSAAITSSGDFSWSSSGDGTFSNLETLSPTYFPGVNDLALPNAVNITLTAFPYCTGMNNAQSTVQLYFQDEVAVFAGNDDDFCAIGSYFLDQATATDFQFLIWSTSGDGFFIDPTIVNPNYYPGNNDISNGTVELTLSGFSINPCTLMDVDQLSLSLTASPEANAGQNSTICETDNHQIQNASAQHYSSILWETSGDGTFSNPEIQNPVYYPGTNDKLSGMVTLTLNATGNNPCNFNVSDQKTLNIQNSPVANAGNDGSICQTESYPLQNTSAQNYVSILWETSGDGSFSNPAIQNPTYYPGNNDIQFGTVELTITANGINPCNFSDSDSKTLYIQKNPTVTVGEDQVICDQVFLFGTATDYNSLVWITSGDGTFSNPSSLLTAYYPGLNDFQNLEANIQLFANPIAPCSGFYFDELTLIINIPTVINDLVTDQEVNTNEILTLSFFVENPDLGEFSWFKDDVLIEGESGQELIIDNIAPEDAGHYQCIFTNTCGEITSNLAFIQVLQARVQVFQLQAGWQGISSFIETNETSIPALFQNIENQMIILSDNNGFYWPEQAVNTLGPWDNLSAYKLKMSEGATLMMEGVIRYPGEPISIAPGWSYLPVNTACQVNVEGLFSSYPSIEIIKDMAGTKLYWPAFGINTLGFLQPGHSYQIFNNLGFPIFVEFPGCE